MVFKKNENLDRDINRLLSKSVKMASHKSFAHNDKENSSYKYNTAKTNDNLNLGDNNS